MEGMDKFAFHKYVEKKNWVDKVDKTIFSTFGKGGWGRSLSYFVLQVFIIGGSANPSS